MKGMETFGELICQIIFSIYLIILSYMDIRKRKLCLAVLVSGIPMAILSHICIRDTSVILILAGIAVGIIFLVISKATDEAFGYGDSILIGILGLLLGFWGILTLLTIAFSIAAIFAMIMLIKNKFTRKSSFPFVPFLTAAYIWGVIIAGGY